MMSRTTIEEFLCQPHIALAGASRSGRKYGNIVRRELTSKGYRVSLVHPEALQIGGVVCYASVEDLPADVGAMLIAVPPGEAFGLVREAVDRGIGRLWLQKGAESPEAIDYGQRHGVKLIHGECILMFAQPTGVHRCHRWLRGVFGRLPA